jgi:Tfp pilus assembly protein PilE
MFDEFTPKRILGALLLLFLILVGVLLYERYTSYFELKKIQKSAEILTALDKITISPRRTSNEIHAIKSQLLHDLQKVVDQKPPTAGLLELLRDNSVSDKTKKFFSGASLWLFLLLLSLPRLLKKSLNEIAPLAVFAFFSLLSGWVATLINLELSVIPTAVIFFLVPLMIVGIFGLILGIAVPQFAAYRMRGYNVEAIRNLRNTKTLLEAYYADNGEYPRVLSQAVETIPEQVNLEFDLLSQNKYILSATHVKGDKIFFASSDSTEITSQDKNVNTGRAVESTRNAAKASE